MEHTTTLPAVDALTLAVAAVADLGAIVDRELDVEWKGRRTNVFAEVGTRLTRPHWTSSVEATVYGFGLVTS